MPTMTVPEVRLPKVDLPQIDLPKVDLAQFDVPKFDLPRVDLPVIDLPHEIEDRLPRRRPTNPLPFVVVAFALLATATWLVAWSPLAPRIRSAVADARVRLGNTGEIPELPTDDGERLDEYEVDPAMFGEPEPAGTPAPSPAFEPDRLAVEEDRVATFGG